MRDDPEQMLEGIEKKAWQVIKNEKLWGRKETGNLISVNFNTTEIIVREEKDSMSVAQNKCQNYKRWYK
jgi:hypothetical protein